MKRRVLFLFLGLFTACDDRYEAIKDFNSPPEILVADQGADDWGHVLLDSVKLSNPAFAYLPFSVQLSDVNQNIKFVSYLLTGHAGELLYRDSLVREYLPVPGNKGTYSFRPKVEGNYRLQFVVVDRFGATDTALLRVLAFNNLPPVAHLVVSTIQGKAYEYLLDGVGSQDMDGGLGGAVVRYRFEVGAEMIDTFQPAIHYIFPGAGSYPVRLTVFDNDSIASETVVTNVVVP